MRTRTEFKELIQERICVQRAEAVLAARRRRKRLTIGSALLLALVILPTALLLLPDKPLDSSDTIAPEDYSEESMPDMIPGYECLPNEQPDLNTPADSTDPEQNLVGYYSGSDALKLLQSDQYFDAATVQKLSLLLSTPDLLRLNGDEPTISIQDHGDWKIVLKWEDLYCEIILNHFDQFLTHLASPNCTPLMQFGHSPFVYQENLSTHHYWIHASDTALLYIYRDRESANTDFQLPYFRNLCNHFAQINVPE